jgi:hypothetical protein
MTAIAYVTEFGLFARDGFFFCLIDSAPWLRPQIVDSWTCTEIEFISRKTAGFVLVTQTSYRCKSEKCKALQKLRTSSGVVI